MIKICTPYETLCRFRLETHAREYAEEIELLGIHEVTVEFRNWMWEVTLKNRVKHERMMYDG